VAKFNSANFKNILLVNYLFLFLFKANAQLSLQDSLIDIQTKNNVVALFDNTVKGNTGLYNGSEYLYGGHNVKGSVLYDGTVYNDVPMRFDLITNELIILDYTKNFPIKLITPKVDYFYN
jgi:hypothetical protein